jgi:3-deoxy-D-manno-octulosonic-acid transferase
LIFLYNIAVSLYFFGIRVAALWNPKAKASITGRKAVFPYLHEAIQPNDKVIWFHCSSAGEFEQGKPIIEEIRRVYPYYKIVLTFFSPSGLKAANGYQHVDFITYLPFDNRANAKQFIDLIKPELIVFVKYEFWYHYLHEAAFRHIPILLVSAVFREDQLFFKAYGSFYRQMLFLYRHIFVQDKRSLELLLENAITHCSISGDTRFDRVKQVAGIPNPIQGIPGFISNNPVLIAGSTWEADEALLANFLNQNPRIKLVIAPHEINATHLNKIRTLFPYALFYSNLPEQKEDLSTKNVLVIDCIGLLSRLYRYGTLCYIGGGFTKDGIHNILEAAVYGKPVIFGPNYHKYREASDLITAGGAFSIQDASELNKIAGSLLSDKAYLQKSGVNAANFIVNNTGATTKIIQFIQEKRLLTIS